jgi:hypothetical protein
MQMIIFTLFLFKSIEFDCYTITGHQKMALGLHWSETEPIEVISFLRHK